MKLRVLTDKQIIKVCQSDKTLKLGEAGLFECIASADLAIAHAQRDADQSEVDKLEEAHKTELIQQEIRLEKEWALGCESCSKTKEIEIAANERSCMAAEGWMEPGDVTKLTAERDAAIKERDDIKAEEWRIVNIVDDLMDSMGIGIQNFPASKWNAWEEISTKVAGKRL